MTLVQASDIAYVQFSSGSTGRPKGVILTHHNILSNVRAIENGLAMHDQDIVLSWMPLYHDMGLIGYHMVPLHLQINGQAIAAVADDASIIRFANVGFPVQDCRVRIVDDKDDVLPEKQLGHIQVTGNLGYMHQGSLVVTGRAKDILFVNGQNCFADDLEHIARQVSDVQAGKVAVCGCFDEQKGRDIFLVFLKSGSPETSVELFMQVKQHLQRAAGVTADAMIPLKSNQFPKTSSGKLQRYKLRQQYEQGLFDDVVAQMSVLLAAEQAKQIKTPPRTVNEKLMHRLWCEELVLKSHEVGIHDHFADLGGKSINAVSIIAKIERRYHMKIHSCNLAENPTIVQLAAYLDKHPLLVPGAKTKRASFFRG